MMDHLEEALSVACAEGVVPGAVLVSTNASGSFNYVKSCGVRSLSDSDNASIDENTILTLTSCTKIVTAIAVMQIVEKGIIGLDDPVDEVLPEAAKLQVLTSMKDGKPSFAPRKNPLTLRRLLSHSSGMSYHHMSPLLHSYIQSIGEPGPPKSVVGSFSTPLIYEPGTSWSYGPGVDWAGLAVSRLTKMPLEDYLQKNVFGLLGITDITFWPNKNPSSAKLKSTLALRDPQGSGRSIPYQGPNPVEGAEEELAGQGLFASAKSYLKILKSLLVDDETLLSRSTTALMFEPQLTSESQAALQALYESQPARGPCSVGEFPPDLQYNWGISGLLSMENRSKDGRLLRRKGCLNWSGMLNLFWWIDREAGLCGLFGAQVIPSGDKKIKELTTLFESTMYDEAAHHAKG